MGNVAHIEKIRNAYKVLIKKCQLKISLGRPRHNWEHNIKM